MKGELRIHLTGEVRFEAGAKRIAGASFPGRLGRLSFAYLVAEHDRPVPREELAEMLWSGEPPNTWEKGTAVLVSRLRALLGDVQTNGRELLSFAYGCYQLHLPPGTWIDIAVAQRSVADAEAALTAGDHGTAIEEANASLAIARQEFLPGDSGDWVDRVREGQRRVVVRSLDCVAEAQLQLGHPREAVVAAKEAVALEPYREGGYRTLMRAHAAAGNRAEALRVHEECRKLLSEELGVDPSPETTAVHVEILRSKPRSIDHVGLTQPVASPLPRQPATVSRRTVRTAQVLAGVAAVGIIVAVVLTTRGGNTAPPSVIPGIDTVGRLNESTGTFTLAASVGQRPNGVAVGDQFVWVTNYTSQTVSWLNPATGAVVGTRSVGGPPTGIAAGGGSIWITAQFGLANGTGGSVLRFDSVNGDQAPPIPVGDGVNGIAFGDNAAWVTNAFDNTIVRIDALTSIVGHPIAVGRQPVAIAVSGNSVWVANQLDGTVMRIDAATGMVKATIAVPTPSAIAADPTGVWVVSTLTGSVTRIDPTTNGTATTLQVGTGPTAISLDRGSAWVAVGGADKLVRIDEATNHAIATAPVQGHPDAVESVGGVVWVTVHA
jgi:SARP family transcriptional regulator, regulator of embCAB operon